MYETHDGNHKKWADSRQQMSETRLSTKAQKKRDNHFPYHKNAKELSHQAMEMTGTNARTLCSSQSNGACWGSSSGAGKPGFPDLTTLCHIRQNLGSSPANFTVNKMD